MAFQIQQGLFQYVDVDHYAVLGAPLGGDIKEVRQCYLMIARMLHPDTCKLTTNAEKKRANQLLSKSVNPSWENLSREQSRQEFRLTLVQLGRGLAQDQDRVKFKSEIAQKLLESAKKGKNPELEYRSCLKSLTKDLYTSVDNISAKIGEISELNLAYLVLIEGKISGSRSQSVTSMDSGSAKPATATAAASQSSTQADTSSAKSSDSEQSKESPLQSYLRRAKDYIEQNNYAQAVLEMRDAIKIEPNNSTCHALLGTAYLRQGQIAMAKVHINTALKYNPKDSLACEAKEELNKLDPKSQGKDTDSGKKSKASSSFWGLFGGGNKNK